ncbi:disease resistance protein RPM1-like [Telopea speciosissima]|uniref:disease resistance protein RPM1-like n=1 Tax=Telopea speciosissima TaxID=54955 RepID=UPI001CC39CD1|nr:disease resistance protein RPM1-like [Telopea speciosissima]
MGTTVTPYELSGLSGEESWALFRRKAALINGRSSGGEGGGGGAVAINNNADDDDLVFRIGKRLVEECKGFPLALTILATIMRFKTFNIQEWETILNTMKVRGGSNNDVIVSVLMICYNEMESPLKRCFSYCYSLLPVRNSTIEKKKLIQLWMAQGLLEEEEEEDAAYIFKD